MGGTVAKRLLDAGHTLHGWNRTREKAQWLVEQGMLLADSPREVAERSDVVFAMVTNTQALDAVARGPDGIIAGLSPGKFFVAAIASRTDGPSSFLARLRESASTRKASYASAAMPSGIAPYRSLYLCTKLRTRGAGSA